MNYRTDLAVENQEMLEKRGSKLEGIEKDIKVVDDNISVTRITIKNELGEKMFNKKRGTYVTLEVTGIGEGSDDIKEKAAKTLAEYIKEFIPFHYYLKVLLIGLGNEKVTADSLGPHTVDKVKITSHLFKIFDCDGDEEMANVSGFNPSVTGVTGLETADVIESLVKMTEPEVVLVIDSLAARNIERVSTTIQLCDTGISPGAGMGNRRKEISQETLGCRVISVGVPTVIDSRTLIMEAAEELHLAGEPQLLKYFETRKMDMIVTASDIDQIIKDFSDIISKAINISLHPGIYF